MLLPCTRHLLSCGSPRSCRVACVTCTQRHTVVCEASNVGGTGFRTPCRGVAGDVRVFGYLATSKSSRSSRTCDLGITHVLCDSTHHQQTHGTHTRTHIRAIRTQWYLQTPASRLLIQPPAHTHFRDKSPTILPQSGSASLYLMHSRVPTEPTPPPHHHARAHPSPTHRCPEPGPRDLVHTDCTHTQKRARTPRKKNSERVANHAHSAA